MIKNCKKLLIVLVVLFSAVKLFAAPMKANDVVYVKTIALEVKAKPGVYAKTVKTVEYASAVTVADVKKGWVQIKLDGTVIGWVPETSLSSRKVAAAKTSVNAKEIALAGRGANDGIEKAFSEAYDEHYDDVDKVEKYASKPSEVLKFIKEGQLNGGEE